MRASLFRKRFAIRGLQKLDVGDSWSKRFLPINDIVESLIWNASRLTGYPSSKMWFAIIKDMIPWVSPWLLSGSSIIRSSFFCRYSKNLVRHPFFLFDLSSNVCLPFFLFGFFQNLQLPQQQLKVFWTAIVATKLCTDKVEHATLIKHKGKLQPASMLINCSFCVPQQL